MLLIKNIVASVVMWLWPLALSIVSTRVLITGLGVEGYGVLVLVTSVTALLGFVSSGLGYAVVKHISHDIAVGDRDSARAVVGTSIALSAAAGAAAVWVLNLFSTAIINGVLHVTDALAASAHVVVLLISLTFGVGLVSGIYYAVLVALQHYGALARARLVTATLLATAQVGLVWLGKGLTWLAAAGLALGVVNLALLVIYVAHSERSLAFQPAVDKRALKKLLSFGTFRTVDMVATLILMQIDRVIIGAYRGAAGIAFYSIPQSLAQQFSHMATSLAEPLFPRFSEMLATGDREGVRRLYRKGTRLLVWFVITTVVTAIAMSDALFRHWLGAAFAVRAAPIMLWLLMGWGLMAASLVSIFALNAFGLPGINAGVRLLQGAALLMACLGLVPRLGPVGAAYGLAGGMLLTIPLFLAYVDRRLNLRSTEVAVDLYVKPLLIGAVVLATGLALRNPNSGLGYDAALVALLPGLSVGLALVLGTISRDERSMLAAALGKALRRARTLSRQSATADSGP